MSMEKLVDRQIWRSRAMERAAMEPIGFAEPHGPVITISRQLGGQGRQIAQRLAERLGWSLWDKDLIDAIAQDAEVDRKIVEFFDEKIVSEIDSLARFVVGEADAGKFMYRKHLIRTLLAIAKRGNAIILGRGANFLLTGALNIRLISCEEARIQNIMDTNHLSRHEALDRIHQSDRDRAAFIRKIYNSDIEDPSAYDLTITTDSFTVDGAAEVIVTALQFLQA